MMTTTDVMTNSLPKISTITKFREITRTEKSGRVDGYEVDPHTAFIVCSVHDAIKPANQKEIMKLPVPDLLCVCIQLVG